MALAYAHAPLSGQGALRFGGRWNPPGHFPVVYLAHPRQAFLAELRRAIDLTTRPARPGPRRLFRIRVHDLRVLDLTTEQRLAAVGLTRADLESDEPTACQEVGRLAHLLDYQGIHAPSTTSHGDVLAVFERRLDSPGQLEVVDSEDLDSNDLLPD